MRAFAVRLPSGCGTGRSLMTATGSCRSRTVPAAPPGRNLPRQRERLRGQPADLTVEVQQHRVIAFQPRLEPDMPARSRQPPHPREMPLTPVRGKIPDRHSALEHHPGNAVQARRLPLREGINPADLNASGTRALHVLIAHPRRMAASVRRTRFPDITITSQSATDSTRWPGSLRTGHLNGIIARNRPGPLRTNTRLLREMS